MNLKKTTAWKYMSLWVRKRNATHAGYVACFTCGKMIDWKYQAEAGHFVHRFSATFFDERNVEPQCTNCNRNLAGNGGPYAINLDEKHGSGTAKELIRKSKEYKQWTDQELKELAKVYKAKFEAL